MSAPNRDRAAAGRQLFWGAFTLAALVWVLVVFAVSMTWRRSGPPVVQGGSSTPGPQEPSARERFKTAAMAGEKGDRKRYTHEEYYPRTGKRKSSEELYYGERWTPIRHGQATAWYENGGKQCEGRWDDGRRAGTWLAWHENGQLWVQGEFAGAQPVGDWQYYDGQGRPCGRRTAGVKTGNWTEWNRQHDTLGSGAYEDGLQDGPWSFKNAEGQIVLELTYRRGVIDGPAVLHQPVRVEYQVERNKEIPSRRRLALDGQFYSADDPATGKTVGVFDAPQFGDLQWVPLDAPFDPDLLVTEDASWENGQPKSKLACKVVTAGSRVVHVPHGQARNWYANGQLHREQAYSEGLPHGTFRQWYPDGQSAYEVEFLLGQPAGRWTFWHPNGRKQAEGTIRPGFPKEHWTFWNADGSRAETPDVWDWISKRSPLTGEGSPPLPSRPSPEP